MKELRPGFLMYSNTVAKNFAYQGQAPRLCVPLLRQGRTPCGLPTMEPCAVAAFLRPRAACTMSVARIFDVGRVVLERNVLKAFEALRGPRNSWSQGIFVGEPGHKHEPILMTGDGRPVAHVTIENIRLNDYASDPNLASQLAVWVAQTTHPEPTSNVKVKNLAAGHSLTTLSGAVWKALAKWNNQFTSFHSMILYVYLKKIHPLFSMVALSFF